MREAEEVEGLRLPEAAPAPVGGRIRAKLQPAGSADISAYRSDGIVWTAQLRLALAAPPTGNGRDPSSETQCVADRFIDYQACVFDATGIPDPSERSNAVNRCTSEFQREVRACVGILGPV